MGETTAEALRRDPSILVARKEYDGTPAPKSFEGIVGAVIFNGSYFVTSPNMDHIWAPPNNPRMTFKQDMRLGNDDPLLWPQPFIEQFGYYSAIRRKPADLKSTDLWYIVYHQLQDADCDLVNTDTLIGLYTLGGARIGQAKTFIRIKIEKKLSEHRAGTDSSSNAPSQAILDNIFAIITRTLSHLQSLPMSRRQVYFLFAELQRYFLEFVAAYEYFNIYMPRMVGAKPAATEVAHVIGAFVQSASQAEAFFLAGLPVWLIRPAKLAGSVRIDSLCDLLDPEHFLCLADAFDQFPVDFRGPPTNPQKYFTFGRYCRNYISYGDAFQLQTSTSSVIPPSQSPSRTLRDDKRPYPKSKKTGHSYRLDEPNSEYLPPSTEIWTSALSSLSTNPERTRLCGISDSESAHGYVLPNPMLFIGTSSDKIESFFRIWLKYRPALLFRLTDWKNRPLKSQIWRDFLHLSAPSSSQSLGLSATSSSHPTKSSLRKNIILDILKDSTQNFEVRMSGSTSSTSNLFWKGHQVDQNTSYSGILGKEILWELAELNFRAELRSLDQHLHRDQSTSVPLIAHYTREDEILFCLAGSQRTGIFVADINMAGSGIAAADWMIRRPYILALKKVMSTWVGFQQAAAGAKVNIMVGMSTVLNYPEHQFLEFETSLVRLYVQFFFDCFNRPPTLPRRLDHAV